MYLNITALVYIDVFIIIAIRLLQLILVHVLTKKNKKQGTKGSVKEFHYPFIFYSSVIVETH